MVVPKGFKICNGGCGKVLEENGDHFPVSKASKTGFSNYCKSCYDARYGKKDVPDGFQRCKGECGQVLKLSGENFARSKTHRSGFYSKCKSCRSAEQKARKDAARGDKPKKRVRPQKDLPAMPGRVRSSVGDERGKLCPPQEQSFWILFDLQNQALPISQKSPPAAAAATTAEKGEVSCQEACREAR